MCCEILGRHRVQYQRCHERCQVQVFFLSIDTPATAGRRRTRRTPRDAFFAEIVVVKVTTRQRLILVGTDVLFWKRPSTQPHNTSSNWTRTPPPETTPTNEHRQHQTLRASITRTNTTVTTPKHPTQPHNTNRATRPFHTTKQYHHNTTCLFQILQTIQPPYRTTRLSNTTEQHDLLLNRTTRHTHTHHGPSIQT